VVSRVIGSLAARVGVSRAVCVSTTNAPPTVSTRASGEP
jgi:hypothetical protein